MDDAKNLLKEYINKFHKRPPIFINMSYDEIYYKKALKNAIENDKEMTFGDLKKAFGNVPFDLDVNENIKTFKTFKKGSN